VRNVLLAGGLGQNCRRRWKQEFAAQCGAAKEMSPRAICAPFGQGRRFYGLIILCWGVIAIQEIINFCIDLLCLLAGDDNPLFHQALFEGTEGVKFFEVQ
jgi:hypothetical protein